MCVKSSGRYKLCAPPTSVGGVEDLSIIHEEIRVCEGTEREETRGGFLLSLVQRAGVVVIRRRVKAGSEVEREWARVFRDEYIIDEIRGGGCFGDEVNRLAGRGIFGELPLQAWYYAWRNFGVKEGEGGRVLKRIFFSIQLMINECGGARWGARKRDFESVGAE